MHESTPISETIDVIRLHGGYIGHIFNVPMVRIIIDIDTLETLYPKYVRHAWGVPDPDSNLVKHLIVSYDHDVEKQDSTAIQDLGVEIDRAYDYFLSVSADDKVIPSILELDGVTHIYLDSYSCPFMDRGCY